ncbi:Cyclopropane-fatty-acyl-phospholipid synthase [hydrothermal vent metagenome]|uniref:Cyclopropane-fatty-acyl-phospholipid synthase n=1 Tax=hydrothermal vent metagenome TaxID=652676 RepID=A0A3B1BIL0_9ZZZZ
MLESATEKRPRRFAVGSRVDGLCTSPFSSPSAVSAAKRILKTIFSGYSGPVAVRIWNGETVIGDETSSCALVFNHPGALKDLVFHLNIPRLAEHYLDGNVDVKGDMETLFDLVDFLRSIKPSLSTRGRLAWLARRLASCDRNPGGSYPGAREEERINSPESIARHYDVSNEFYKLWLDPEMVYSCAYFRDADQPLAKAQEDKMDHICRKLRLKPGQTLLDIGCGWGALTRWAARHYGVYAHGITLSEKQYTYAVQQTAKEGLESRVKTELKDYRDIEGGALYDRVVSVGMFEHIGKEAFPLYFGIIKRVLKPDGLFLNHGITNDTGWYQGQLGDFITQYVFPDGRLTKISIVIDAMEKAGFEILDVESLRRHYTLTLRRWINSLEANREKTVAIAGDPVYRLWRLYMAGYAYYFKKGDCMVYQTLAGHEGGDVAPLRREDIYS